MRFTEPRATSTNETAPSWLPTAIFAPLGPGSSVSTRPSRPAPTRRDLASPSIWRISRQSSPSTSVTQTPLPVRSRKWGSRTRTPGASASARAGAAPVREEVGRAAPLDEGGVAAVVRRDRVEPIGGRHLHGPRASNGRGQLDRLGSALRLAT